MKARLTRQQEIRNVNLTKAQRKKLITQFQAGELSRQELSDQLKTVAEAGTIIDHPKAYMLVRLGVAEPADDECRLRADFTDTQIADAQIASERIENAQALSDEQNASAEGVQATKERMSARAERQKTQPAASE